MHFASPYYLWLLSALVPMIAYYVWRTLQGGASIQISSVAGVVRAPRTVRYYLRHLPFALRAAAFALLVVALARPQDVERLSRTNTEGIDIMLAIDVSGSMLARDFKPDRLAHAAHLPVASLLDGDLQNNTPILLFKHKHRRRKRHAPVEHHTRGHLRSLLVRDIRAHRHAVRLGDMVRRVHHKVGKRAVICK